MATLVTNKVGKYSVGPRLHLSAGCHDGQYWVQISNGDRVYTAVLSKTEWDNWQADVAMVSRHEVRAAVLELRRESK